MQQVAGFPYFEVQFNQDGTVHDESEVDAVLGFLGGGEITDLFVISHGWNNDMADARTLYQAYFGQVDALVKAGHGHGLDARKAAVLAVLWPSKRFADEELIPGDAAGVDDLVTNAVLEDQIDNLKGAFSRPGADAALEQARGLIPRLEGSPAARKEFADLVRSVVTPDAAAPPGQKAEDEDASAAVFQADGEELMDELSKPLVSTRRQRAGDDEDEGGAAGGMDGSGDAPQRVGSFEAFLRGQRAAARRLLNYVTYYQMKERAGVVGRDGLNGVLRRVRDSHPKLRLHLIGHSFGGRVVTAAAVGPDDKPSVNVATMTLLQAAFSHNSFAEKYDGTNPGFFRRLVTDKMVTGPVVISHTVNDTAVGQAYPIASRIAGQDAAAVGDENDRYGGLGRNGAQKTDEAVPGTLLEVGKKYQFEAGRIYNLRADEHVKHHGDVTGEQIVHAMLAAVATT